MVVFDTIDRDFSRVTILARNEDKLEEAKALLEKENSSAKVSIFSVDVTDPSAIQAVASTIYGDDGLFNLATYLFTCAGTSHPGKFQEMSSDIFSKQANLNYLGAIYTVRAFLPFIKRGTVALTSSAAGQVGVYGFTAYSPTKFALRGFAESLHMELLSRRHLHVQVVYPPDTNTPGYAAEQAIKPKACHDISETAGLFEPGV